jgi:DNA-binding NtrC family response regulator
MGAVDEGGPTIIGDSPLMQRLLSELRELAEYDVPVLLIGETGTGKELGARALHEWGRRRGAAFVPTNCGGIPDTLFEAECFGYSRGAFTGAENERLGLVGQAEHGTLFLDEIDSLPLGNQVKLLRFLQSNEYRRVGADRAESADVRVVAATGTDLSSLEAADKFRSDLRYRLEVMTVTMPPLRERREDVPLLARHFVDKYAKRYERGEVSFGSAAMAMLCAFEWPGNVRQLENIVHRAVIRARGAHIGREHLGIDVHSTPSSASPGSFREAKERLVAEFEVNYIRQLLTEHRGNVTRAARAAKKHRRAFLELMRRHDIKRDDFVV